jgi:hypothetical protein
MFHFFHLHREAFLSRYHQRSNVESTFSMVKAKFGDGVRSKTDVAMRNECLCKFLCHNICCVISAMHELGIDPTFRAEWSVAQKVPVAHKVGDLPRKSLGARPVGRMTGMIEQPLIHRWRLALLGGAVVWASGALSRIANPNPEIVILAIALAALTAWLIGRLRASR